MDPSASAPSSGWRAKAKASCQVAKAHNPLDVPTSNKTISTVCSSVTWIIGHPMHLTKVMETPATVAFSTVASGHGRLTGGGLVASNPAAVSNGSRSKASSSTGATEELLAHPASAGEVLNETGQLQEKSGRGWTIWDGSLYAVDNL